MPASERWVGCAAVARENDESLRGTAARAHGWVLIEHRGPWGREPWGPDGPLGRIGTELSRRCKAVGIRPQLVRETHGRREPTETRQVFLAHSGRRGPWLERYTVDTVEQILELPLEAAAAGTPPGIGTRVDQRLYLVCTHGKKDPCCAVLRHRATCARRVRRCRRQVLRTARSPPVAPGADRGPTCSP